MANMDEKAARIALLTRAVWDEGLPPPLTRRMYSRLCASGALSTLVLRSAAWDDPALSDRARLLMSRVGAAGRYLCQLEEQGYDMLLPGDVNWPVRLRSLGEGMPQFLCLKGNRALLGQRAISVAGSRDISAVTARLAAEIGEKIAEEGFVMVCGGARGTDDAAQRALLEAGGSLILVPALPVRELLHGYAYLRAALDEGRLLMLCDTLPEEPFSPAKALERNHTIYALGEAAVVVASRKGTGGSWRGAADCLRLGYTPVYVPDGAAADMEGNRALMEIGAGTLDITRKIGEQLHARRTMQLDMFVLAQTGGVRC